MSLGNFKTIVETADKMLTATRAREFTESVRARGSFELAPQPGIELVLPPLLPLPLPLPDVYSMFRVTLAISVSSAVGF